MLKTILLVIAILVTMYVIQLYRMAHEAMKDKNKENERVLGIMWHVFKAITATGVHMLLLSGILLSRYKTHRKERHETTSHVVLCLRVLNEITEPLIVERLMNACNNIEEFTAKRDKLLLFLDNPNDATGSWLEQECYTDIILYTKEHELPRDVIINVIKAHLNVITLNNNEYEFNDMDSDSV